MIFRTDTAEFSGFEMAQFRLREGVTEQQLLAVVKRVDDEFLSHQPDLYAHFLLRGKDGIYADVAIATTQQRAEQICQSWLTNDVALQYLQLLDESSVDMSFWTRIS